MEKDKTFKGTNLLNATRIKSINSDIQHVIESYEKIFKDPDTVGASLKLITNTLYHMIINYFYYLSSHNLLHGTNTLYQPLSDGYWQRMAYRRHDGNGFRLPLPQM